MDEAKLNEIIKILGMAIQGLQSMVGQGSQEQGPQEQGIIEPPSGQGVMG